MRRKPIQDHRVRNHLLELYYDQILQIYPSVWVFPLVVTFLLWSSINSTILLVWLLAGFAVDSVVYKFRISMLKNIKASKNLNTDKYNKIVKRESLLLVISSLRWSFAGFVFYLPEGFIVQALIYATILGLVSSFISYSAYQSRLFYFYSAPILLSIIARLFLSVEVISDAVFFFIALLTFYIASIKSLKNQEARYIEAAELKFANLELIADLSKAKETAEKANRHKSSFLAAASHDLRQPVQSLRFLVDSLKRRANKNSNQDLVEMIDRSSNSLFMLLDNLLDISKLDAGAVKYSKIAVSVRELFEQLEIEFRPVALKKNLEFVVAPIDEFVFSDASLLYRIMSNLLDNASKYTKHGQIKLTASLKDDRKTIVFTVSDTGIGIPPDKQQIVFEEFQQLHNPSRDSEKGLGLGLSLCERMVNLLQHKIHLESVAGQGTSVAVELERSAKVKRQEAVSASEPQLLTDKNILIIDDEKDVLESLRIILESWQANVIAAGGEDEVMMILEYLHDPLDIIICDYRLKDSKNGIVLVGLIKHKIDCELPAIILTGDVTKPELVQIDNDNLKVLSKPISAEKLNMTISGLLD